MRKADIVQTTLLVVAIMIGYSVVQSTLSMLAELPLLSGPYAINSFDFAVWLITPVLLAVACFILIRKSRRFAVKILESVQDDSLEDVVHLDLDRRTVLFVVFIGIGLYVLLQGLAYALDDAYTLFKIRIAGPATLLSKRNYLTLELLRTTFGAFLIYAAPTVTDFIEKSIAVRLKPQTPETPTNIAEVGTDTQSS